jgi:lipoprotein-releasing system permease protein
MVLALVLLGALWTMGLDLMDRLSRRFSSFELVVALRHLRGHKSGYLRAMTVVVLFAMTMVNCALPTVLSVMGGFGNDLKLKILEATAHVLVDSKRPNLSLPVDPTEADLDRLAAELRDHPDINTQISATARTEGDALIDALEKRGIDRDRLDFHLARSKARKGVRVIASNDDRTLRDYDALVREISQEEGVIGVTPFIEAHVMLASQTNIASVILKGVDPTTMNEVIGLQRTIKQGKIAYLEHPERILPDVISEQERRLKLLLADAGIEEDMVDGGDSETEEINDSGLTLRVRGEVRDPSPPAEEQDAGDPEAPPDEIPAVIVGQELAKTLRGFVGDEVNAVSPLGGMGPMGPIPKTRPFRIAGVFFSGMYQDDAKNAYVRLDVAQRFLGLEGRVTGIRIKVKNIEQAGQVADRIRARIGPSYRVRPWDQVNANLFSALLLEKIAMFAVFSVFFIICAFLIASTLTMMVLEKRRGIAVLKTIGANNRQLGAVFMLQGVMAGIVGTISGQASGLSICVALGRFVAIDPEVYYIDRLPVAIEASEFAAVAGAGLVTAAVATLLPLAATVFLRPVDGLRP